jgi:predicted nucleic acid-binding protein
MDFRKCDKCVSDADVLIKFARGGQMDLLGRIVPSVVIPDRVRREVLTEIGLHGPLSVFVDAIRTGWVTVIDTDGGSDLTPAQLLSVRIFNESYRDLMDSGELMAAALASEMGIPIMFSDDRRAQRIIQEVTSIAVLRIHEVLALGVLKGAVPEAGAVKAFNAINETQDHPVTSPAGELIHRALACLERPL